MQQGWDLGRGLGGGATETINQHGGETGGGASSGRRGLEVGAGQ